MQPDSDWLRALTAREAAASVALLTVVFSHHDNLVAPQSIQTLAGARTIEVAARGHVELVCDRAVWVHAAQAIDASARR